MARAGHPHALALSRYLDRDLPAREHRTVDEHVRDCVVCRRLIASLSRAVLALPSLRDERPSSRADVIISTLRAAIPGDGTSGRRWTDSAGGPAAVGRFSWARSLRGFLRLCTRPSQLRITLPITLLAGMMLSLVNQGGKVLAGEIGTGMCVVCGFNFLLPFVGLNVVVVIAATVASRRG